MTGISNVHKYAHDHKSGVGERNEENTPGRVIQNDGKRKAEGVCGLNNKQLPLFLFAVCKEKSANEVCKVEERAAECAYKQEVEEEHKAAHSLHDEEVSVFLTLERPNYYYKTDNAQALSYKLGLTHFGYRAEQ